MASPRGVAGWLARSCESICKHGYEGKSGSHGRSPCAWPAYLVMPEVQRFCKVAWGFSSVWVLRPFCLVGVVQMSQKSQRDWHEGALGMQMVRGDSQCRGKLLLLTKPDATDSSFTSCSCKHFLSEWDWAILVLWMFRGSAVMFRGSRTRYWCSVPWHKGRKLKGIIGGETSVSQGI